MLVNQHLPLDCSPIRKDDTTITPRIYEAGMDAPPRAPQRDHSPIRKTMALHLSFTETTQNCF
jgi:hypothetical protein